MMRCEEPYQVDAGPVHVGDIDALVDNTQECASLDRAGHGKCLFAKTTWSVFRTDAELRSGIAARYKRLQRDSIALRDLQLQLAEQIESQDESLSSFLPASSCSVTLGERCRPL